MNRIQLICLITLFACAAAPALSADAPHSVSGTFTGNSFTLNPDLTSTANSNFDVYLQTDKSTYITGEPVHIYFSVTNRGPKPALLDWTPGSRADLFVMQGDTVLWTLGGPARLLGGSQPFPVAVGEVFELGGAWNMTDNMTYSSPVPLPPGDYTLGAYLAGAGGLTLPITIVPDPATIVPLLAVSALLVARQRRRPRYNRGQP